MPSEQTELRNLQAHEVSIVDKGANRKKRFPIFKQESQMNDQIIEAVLKTEGDDETSLDEFIKEHELDEVGIAALKGLQRLASGFKDKLPASAFAVVAKAVGYDEPVEKAKPEKEMTSEDEKKKKELEEEEEMQMDKSLEGLPEEIRKQFEDAQKAQEEIRRAQESKIEELEKSLKAETDRRELEAWVVKCKEHLTPLPGKRPEEHAEAFKKLADADRDFAEAQFEVLKSAAETVKKSRMYEEIGGKGQDTTGSAYAKLTKIAKNYIEKSNSGLTHEQAFLKAMEDNPNLYAQYMDENPAQMGRG